MKQNLKTKPLTYNRAAFVRMHILQMEGSREYSKSRQQILSAIGKLYPSLELGKDSDPTENDIAKDKALPQQCLNLTAEEWNSLKVGCIKILLGSASEGEKSSILAFSKLVRCHNECWKAMPDCDKQEGTPDDEEEDKPDSENDSN